MGWRTFRRLKASNCSVSEAALSPAVLISRTCCDGRFVALQTVLKEVAVGEDGGDQIVEVVGDAAGEPANRLHLLGLAQMLLALAPSQLG